MSACAHVQACEPLCVTAEVGCKTRGVLGNGIACSQRAYACASISAFFPKNKMTALPWRPYGTDNEPVLATHAFPDGLRERGLGGSFCSVA